MPSYEGILSWIFCQSPRSNHNVPGVPELDVVTLRWNGEQVARREMEQGETWSLDVTRPLPGPATVEVVVRPNEDGSVEDVIGSVQLSAADVGTGLAATDFHEARFDEAGAQYELTYKVRQIDDVPGPAPTPAPAPADGVLSWIFCESPRSNHNVPGVPEVDVVTLRWNGEQVARREMEQGETWSLDVTRPLPGPATVEVVVRPNEDGSVEDVIGSVQLATSLAGAGFQVARFDDAGARYELTYRVNPHDPGDG
ncbi:MULTISPECIES: hypothetical protein [Streptomyces]|uniref:hypothetical protein n=1 Tax=Streptomyces TaxID=1883 RepID=UPI0007CD4306|nr:hypothetical protein A4V12_30720 [Streptomyces noursei]